MRQNMLYLRKTPAQSAVIFYILTIGFVLLPTDWLGELFFEDATSAHFFGMGVLRVAMFAVMAVLAWQTGIAHVLFPQRRNVRALLWCLPALVVAVNNFPLVALAAGTAEITAGAGAIALYALYCAGIGLFEEMAFRGVVFPLVLGKTGTGKKGRVLAVLVSAAAFGLLHLVNLLGGFSPAVFLQVGYSFLIGAMLAVCMFRGAGVGFCALAHAVFNFGGNVVQYCGVGAFADLWCAGEVVLTAVVGVAAAAYFVWLILHSPADAADRFAVFPPAPEPPAGDASPGAQDEIENKSE